MLVFQPVGWREYAIAPVGLHFIAKVPACPLTMITRRVF